MRYIRKDSWEAKRLDRHPSIHHTGSVIGMKRRGYWGKKDICVRCGQYIYNLSISIR